MIDMKAVQIAFLVICIQIGMGIVTMSGLFEGMYYENDKLDFNIRTNISAQSEAEQTQGSIDVYNMVVDTLTWGWIKEFFQPFYSNSTAVKEFVDGIILLLDVVSTFLIGVALFEFLRDRTSVL